MIVVYVPWMCPWEPWRPVLDPVHCGVWGGGAVHIVPDCDQYSHYYQPGIMPIFGSTTAQSIMYTNLSQFQAALLCNAALVNNN